MLSVDPKSLRPSSDGRGAALLALGAVPLLVSITGAPWPFELASHFVVHAALALLASALVLVLRARRRLAVFAFGLAALQLALCEGSINGRGAAPQW